MKRIAIIGGGVMASYFGKACKHLELESHQFSLPDGKVEPGIIDFFHEIDIFKKDKIVEICQNLDISGVVATTELTVYIAAYVAEKLGLLGINPSVAKVITDKFRNRECIKHLKKLRSPEYYYISSYEELNGLKLPFPIIIKPINRGGKRGITVVKSNSELKNAFEYAKSCFKKDETPHIIIEQYLQEGIECSVESLTINGHHNIIQITQKDSENGFHCVELGHHQPANITEKEWNDVIDAVSEGLTAIGLTHGPCHTEIKIINGLVYLIEFNARPGGDHIAHPLVQLSTGYDYIAGIIKASMGDLSYIDKSKFKHRYAGLYYVVKQTSFLKELFDKCEDYPWCVEKHKVSSDLVELTHNDLIHNNYFMYVSETGNPVDAILKNI